MDSSYGNSAQTTSNSKPSTEVDASKDDTLSMGNSNNKEPAKFKSKPSSEIDVTKRNTAVSVDDATCKRSRDAKQCSSASKMIKNDSSDAVTSPSTRNRIVVFDIDNTLCKSSIFVSNKEEEIIRKSFPECPFIIWNQHSTKSGRISRHPHIFLPHLNILLDYLLEQGVRIVFFSSAPKERNQTVIPELLTSFWGTEKFEALKSKGQFDIFSEEHLRDGSPDDDDEGNEVNDLKIVIRDGETLSDAILVEDDPSYVVHDQKPCLRIIDLMFWGVRDKDKAERDHESGKSYNFRANSVYYMLGVFKTYFGNEKYKVLPFREGLNQLLSDGANSTDGSNFFEKHSFADDMIDLGLSEVQKLVPNAMYY